MHNLLLVLRKIMNRKKHFPFLVAAVLCFCFATLLMSDKFDPVKRYAYIERMNDARISDPKGKLFKVCIDRKGWHDTGIWVGPGSLVTAYTWKGLSYTSELQPFELRLGPGSLFSLDEVFEAGFFQTMGAIDEERFFMRLQVAGTDNEPSQKGRYVYRITAPNAQTLFARGVGGFPTYIYVKVTDI